MSELKDNERKNLVKKLLSGFSIETVFSGKKYNLEEEYAATRKNSRRHYWKKMWLPLLCTIAGVLLLSLVVGTAASRHNKAIKVDVNEFEDLNLRNLLSDISQAKNQHDDAVLEKNRVSSEWEKSLAQAERNRSLDIYNLDALNLENKKEYDARLQEIEETYEKTVESINTEYEARVNVLSGDIDSSAKKLQEYESAEKSENSATTYSSSQQLQNLQRQEMQNQYQTELLDMQDYVETVQKQDFERQQQAVKKITDKYQAQIARLDPVISEQKSSSIVNGINIEGKTESFFGTRLSTSLSPDASEEYKAALEHFRSDFTDLETVEDSLSKAAVVEHKRDIPRFIKAISRIAHKSGNDFAEASVNEVNSLIQQNQQLQDTQKSFEAYMDKFSAYDRFVLSNDNNGKIEAYIRSNLRKTLGAAYIGDAKNPVAAGYLIEDNGTVFFIPGDFWWNPKAGATTFKSAEEDTLQKFDNTRKIEVYSEIHLMPWITQKAPAEDF